VRSAVTAFALVAFLSASLAPSRAGAADDDPWTGTDKTVHFAASAGIAAGGYAVGTLAFDARGHALVLGGTLTLVIGAGKELADLAGAGTPSWKDFAWDAMGAVAGLAVAWGIDLLVRGVGERHPLFVAPAKTARGAGILFEF